MTRRLLMAAAAAVLSHCSADHRPFKVDPPTRLDIVYPIGTTLDDALADCTSGELIGHPGPPIVYVCEGVNY